jgi:hypothetical protein
VPGIEVAVKIYGVWVGTSIGEGVAMDALKGKLQAVAEIIDVPTNMRKRAM